MTKPITTDRYTLTVNRGSCPRTASGYRLHPAFATIRIGEMNHTAIIERKDHDGKAGWMARYNDDYCAIIECWARTQVQAATAMAETLADNAAADALLPKCSECGCNPRLRHGDLCETCAEDIGSRHDEDPYASARRECEEEARDAAEGLR
jgi:hypothetical protein